MLLVAIFVAVAVWNNSCHVARRGPMFRDYCGWRALECVFVVVGLLDQEIVNVAEHVALLLLQQTLLERILTLPVYGLL